MKVATRDAKNGRRNHIRRNEDKHDRHGANRRLKRGAGRPRKDSSTPDQAAKRRLLRAAAGIFAEKGYAATSVREIVAEAELTQPVLYYYFSNKEGLFLGLMNEVADKFDTILGHIAALKGGSRIKLITLFESIGKLHNENMDLVKMMHALLYGPPQAAPNYDFHRFHDRMRGVVRKLVVEGIRNGEFRKMNVGDVMWSLLGILKITLESQLCHPETSPGLSGMKRMLGIFFHGIEKRGRA